MRYNELTTRAEIKQYEVKGYEQMLARMLEGPLKIAADSNNLELQQRLKAITGRITE